MGNMIVSLQDVRIAGVPTFIPGPTVDQHKLLVTVLNNRKKKNGDKMLDEISLTFWGKYAQVGAVHLEKGRAINVIGELRSYKYETGHFKPSGAKVIQRDNSVNVQSFTFSAESAKSLAARINANLAKAKADGRLDPNTNITGEELIAIGEKKAIVDYNPQIAAVTGTYGNAKVWIKDSGLIAATPTVADVEARLVQMKAQLNNANANAVVPDPFKEAAAAA